MSRDVAVGAALIVLAGLYWLGADRIRVSVLEGGVGAQAVPKSLAVVLALLAALMMLQSAWRRRRGIETPPGRAAEPAAANRHLRALGMLLIGVGYLVLVNTLGYVLAIGLMMLATAAYIGQPLSARLVGIAAGGSLVYYLLFVIFLDIPLPAGIWPGLWRQLAG